MTGPKYYGCHVSNSGGFENALSTARELNINAIQVHPSAPQRWVAKPFAPGIEGPVLEARSKSGVEKFFFHGIYLINLATANPQQKHMAGLSLIHYLDLNSRFEGDGVIFHVGSFKDQPDEEAGFKQVAETIDDILSKSPNNGRLLLEVSAGSGAIIGDRLEELRSIYDLVEQQDRVGFALDSQHMWASGYDLQNDLEGVLDQIERIFTWEKVGCWHLNDSMTALASRKDRHENFGEGLIGKEAMERLFLHPKLKNVPFVLETPCLKTVETAKQDIEKLHRLAGKF